MNTRPAPNDPPRIRLVAPVAAVAGGLLSPVSWSAPGDLDSAFGDVGRVDPLPDLSGQLWSLEVLENGDSVLAGNEEEYFFYWGAYYDEHGFFTAIGPEGEALADFAAGRLDNFSVRDLVRTADGKLVAVGESDDLRRIRIVRINADGTADPGFGTGGFVDVSFPGSAPVAGPALVADADGRITVFGISSSGEFLMARVLPSGAPDVTFGSNGVLSTTVPGVVLSPYSADALVRLSDGTFRVTVRARPAGSTDTYACRIVAVSAKGELLAGYGDGGVSDPVPSASDGACADMALVGGDAIVVVGETKDGGSRGFAARILPDGSVDPGFSAATAAASFRRVTALGVGGGGSLALAGEPAAGLSGALVARLAADGTLDRLFGREGFASVDVETEHGAAATVRDVDILPDGAVMLAGASGVPKAYSPFVARLTGDGGGDSPGVLGFKWAVVEASESDGSATLAVRRTGGRTGAASLSYATVEVDGVTTATPGVDFQPVAGQLSWADGDDGERQITIPLVADGSTTERSELFAVELGDTTGAGRGSYRATVTIRGDGYPAGMFLVDDVTAYEENRAAWIGVTRVDGSSGAVSVQVSLAPGTAESGSDYLGIGGLVVTWADGETGTKTVRVALLDDGRSDSGETFTLNLSNPTGGSILGAKPSATVTIVDNDSGLDGDAGSGQTGRGGGGRFGLWASLLLGLGGFARRLRRVR